ncbi:LysR family transcriptional regulator [Paenibacillus sp. HB172176]|uniref:LysR family transcriptional regulator n=1 Tax=Paenibacillus sp. HB172176 TaxID=2493690 RepID=UPI00143ABF4B|nr:LysR family transcriptional regulator [Paenibacillus sp. HB172176]
MDLTYFHTFRTVARRQSFTRAAEELGYAQSSVTTQIQKLEKSYGVQLFERHSKGLRLTTAGEELLRITVQMLDLYQQSKEKLTKQGGGTLHIGTIDSLAAYYLPPIIQQLRERYEELTIQLLPGMENEIVSKVKEGELDIGIILEREPSDPALHWTAIREERLIAVAAKGHPLAGLEPIMLRDLDGMEWIMAEDTCNYRMMLEKVLNKNNIAYQVGLELGNPEAIKRYVMSGTGIALLPQMAVEEEIRRGDLEALPFSHGDISLQLQWFVHPNKWISHALQAFIDSLR